MLVAFGGLGFTEMTNTALQLKKDIFLKAYSESGNVSRAAKIAGIHRSLHYNTWMKDVDYAKAFEDARDQAIEVLEAEVRRRGLEGNIKYKFKRDGTPLKHPHTGEPYYELEHSDNLLMFLLKALKPNTYRERVEHTGPDGGPITIEHLAPMRKPEE